MACDDGLPPQNYGGIQYYVKTVSELLVEGGHKVEVFTQLNPINVYQYQFIVNAVKPYGNIWTGYFSAAQVYFIGYQRLLQAMKKRLKDNHNIDLIHAHNPFMSGKACSKLALETGIPAILHYYAWKSADNFLLGKKIPLEERVAKLSFKGYDAIVTNSQIMRDAVSDRFKIEKEIIKTLPLFVDTKTFTPGIECNWVRRKFHMSKNIPLILFVGRVEIHKGLQYLLNVVSQILKMENIYLLVVGGGSFLENAKALARKLGIENRIIFTGVVPYEELPAYYCASDIFVNPSLDECYSFVLLEAASCGKAIVGNDHPIMLQEFAENGENAVIYKRGDVESMKDAILRLIEDPQLRERMGNRARQKVKRDHSVNVYLNKLLQVYEGVIK